MDPILFFLAIILVPIVFSLAVAIPEIMDP